MQLEMSNTNEIEGGLYLTLQLLPKTLETCTAGASAEIESHLLSELFIAHLQHPSFGLSHSPSLNRRTG